MPVLLRILVDVRCGSLDDAVEQALNLDRNSEPLHITTEDGRVLVDPRLLRRKMAESGSN